MFGTGRLTDSVCDLFRKLELFKVSQTPKHKWSVYTASHDVAAGHGV